MIYKLILYTLLLSGCAKLGSNYQILLPDLPARHRSADLLPRQVSPQIDQWWTLFKDPILNQLIDIALEQNLDLATALARIEQSRALAGLAKADQMPSAQGSGFANLRRDSREAPPNLSNTTGKSYRFLNGQLDSSWELDLFGGLRRARNAASLDFDAAVANRAAIQVSLVADIADNYIRWRALQQRLYLAIDTVEEQKDSVLLMRSRFKAGLVSELDVSQAEALLASFEVVVPGLYSDIQDRSNQLAQLLGMSPEEVIPLLQAGGGIPTAPAIPEIGVPAELLRRRPDIIEAERRVKASSERIGQQIGEYYPKISLLGTLGLQSQDVSTLLNNRASFVSVGPSFQWRILDFKRIDAEVLQAKGVEKEKLALYRKTILIAMQEVDTGLFRLQGNAQEKLVRTRSLTAQVRAYEIALDRYNRGLTDFLPVIDAKRLVNNAKDNMLRASESQSTAAVTLFKALGGGWTPTTFSKLSGGL